MALKVDISELGAIIEKELTVYNEHVVDGLKKEARRSVRKLVTETKATAPVGNRQKHYRDSITSKVLEESYRGVTYVWYVKGSDYRLSHLLERGHQNRDGGRTEGTHFIEKASVSILDEFEQKVKEAIENG